jgi:hypothetical protein
LFVATFGLVQAGYSRYISPVYTLLPVLAGLMFCCPAFADLLFCAGLSYLVA